MSKRFMVGERECCDNYDVMYVSESKEKAVKFISELVGETFDTNGEIDNGNVANYHVAWFERFIGPYKSNITSEIYLEERELNNYEPLSV